MMFLNRIFSLVLLLVVTTVGAFAQNDNRFNQVNFNALTPLEVSAGQGVSAPFVGVVGDKIVVVGGCNFPGVPAAEGGTKEFYGSVYTYEASSWSKHALSVPAVAYGVSVQVPEGLVCIGGAGADGATSAVYLLSEKDGALQTTTLPALPEAKSEAAGAYDGTYIYVAGGETNSAYRLKYEDGKWDAKWENLPALPGRVRKQPAGVVQSAAISKHFYLFGGFAPATESDTAYVHSDGLYYDAKAQTWKPTAPVVIDGKECAIVGASAVTSGVAHVAVLGGVNKDVFTRALNHPEEGYLTHAPEWYQFNQEVYLYHTITNSWVSEAQSEKIARAGAAVVPYQGSWYVIGGESKPGVRSADVTEVSMEQRVGFGWLNWTVLIVYMIGMLGLGYFFMLRENSSEDFFKGGGRIPWWAAGISIYATMLSAITYMAIPAKAYATDWTYYPMLITILLVSFPVIKYFLPYFRRLNITSAYEYLEMRFNLSTRLIASALFIVFMVARTALVLYLPSLALTAVTGIDIYTCIILMGLITIVYCTMGGVEAVVWGDVVQGIILVGGAFLAAGYLIFNTEGGASGFFGIAIANDKFRLFDYAFDLTSATFWVVILGGLANNLISYTSDQTVIQRYITTKDEKSAGRSILMNGIMSVFISVSFYVIGTGLYTFYQTHPAELDFTMQKSDAIFPFFMMSQMPAGVAGLLIAAIFAATMSTISSNISSVSTAFSVDFYRRFKLSVTDKQMLRVARLSCMLSGLLGVGLALLMATWNILSLLDYFNTILGLLSSGIGGLFLIGIFFKRVGGVAALIGFFAGEAVVFWLNFCTDISFLLYGFIGMFVCVLVGVMLSIFPAFRSTQAQRIDV